MDTDRFSTWSESVTEYAYNVGRDRPDVQWILTNYDTWVRNPFYRGPEQIHPDYLGVDDETDF